MSTFDLPSAPLTGTHLIEAGAGTGKTYSIASIYLRLVLERDLSVEEILVLTFTRAATLELKDRIRKRLVQMLEVLHTGDPGDDLLLRHLLERVHGEEGLRTRWELALEDALMEFDNANILNFHQFCEKVLQNYAVEARGLFEAEILADNQAVLERAVYDFWRAGVYPAHPILAGYLTEHFKPQTLMSLTKTVNSINIAENMPPLPQTPPCDKVRLEEALAEIQRLFGLIKNSWLVNHNEISTLLLMSLNQLYGNVYKEKIVLAMIEQMHVFTHALLPYPLETDGKKLYLKWDADYLAAKTKQKCVTPQHTFFDLWRQMHNAYDQFAEEAAKYVLNLKIDSQAFIKHEMAAQKRLHNWLDFNDLIEMVGRAVLGGERSPLSQRLKQQYQAVMVDEFQDTDPLQYDMFRKLFANTEHLFFMIGDPKQAIYSFRGADVYSYFTAAKQSASAFTLAKNWRSSATLVQAVNTVFGQTAKPFLTDEIKFTPAVAQNGAGRLAGPPLIFWFLDGRREELGAAKTFDKKTNEIIKYDLSNTNAQEAVCKAAAREILRLLQDESTGLKPSDIAVLVNTNHQGHLIFKALSRLGVPAAITATEGVFQSAEARDMLLLLESAAQPDNLPKLKAAYAASVLGGRASEYVEGADDRQSYEFLWQQRLQNMRRWHNLYAERGFLSLFLAMMFSENSFARLLKAPDGRRRVTNFTHLAELLHHKAQSGNLSLMGLARWLSKAVAAQTRTEDDDLRLETDGDVVQIVTVHKSKGLEYEVVFYPFGWQGMHRDGPEDIYKYHENDKLCFEFARTGPPWHRHLREGLAEQLRLLYVALTRAKQRCYVGYGMVKTTKNGRSDRFETSALTYLLFGDELDLNSPDLVEQMHAKFQAMHSHELVKQKLANMAAASEDAIAVVDLPLGAEPAGRYRESPLRANVLKTLERSVTTNWKVASFSSLTKISVAGDIYEGRDLEQDLAADDVDDTALPEEAAPAPLSVFAMPRSAHVGNFFHSLLEDLDFAAAASKPPRDQISSKLRDFMLDEAYAPAVAELIQSLLNANLAVGYGNVALKDAQSVLKEVGFYFPLNLITQEQLAKVFSGGNVYTLPDSFSRQSARFVFAPAEGYLKGFIDLAFCHNGRYYIIDWKSNYEGPRPEDYNPTALTASMARHSYFLQYNLYVLALCQWLRLKMPDFSYGRDFGGIFYVFLRGFARKLEADGDYGVFRDQPPPDLINALGRLLIPGFKDFPA